MSVILLIILLFIGIIILVLIHVCIVEWVFRSGLRRDNHAANLVDRSSTGNTSMSIDDLEKLPSFDFRPKDHGDDDPHRRHRKGTMTSPNFNPSNCVVCLEGFKTGDKCRLLPTCRHSFHAQCVDAWLLKMPSCPICRSRADSSRLVCEASSSSSRFGGDDDPPSAEITGSSTQLSLSDSRSESRERGEVIGDARTTVEIRDIRVRNDDGYGGEDGDHTNVGGSLERALSTHSSASTISMPQ